MAFRQGLALGALAGAALTLLYTPLEGRDTRAILLGPFGWRETETEPDVAWTPEPTPSTTGPLSSTSTT